MTHTAHPTLHPTAHNFDHRFVGNLALDLTGGHAGRIEPRWASDAHFAPADARWRPAVTGLAACAWGRALSALAAAALCAFWAAPAAQAADAPSSVPSASTSLSTSPSPSSASAAATAALQALMGNLPVPGGATSVASSSGSARGAYLGLVNALPAATRGGTPAQGLRSVTVQRGETLDRIIRRTLPGLPLHQDFLRQAFVKLNPQAFPLGTPHLVRAGAVLQVPGMADLRALMLVQHPQAAGLLQAPDMAENSPNGHAANDKRHWVRFP